MSGLQVDGYGWLEHDEPQARERSDASDENLTSPFVGAASWAAGPAPETAPPWREGVLDSPFRGALATDASMDREAAAFAELLAELEDSEFVDALEALVDEAAALHLMEEPSWSTPEAGQAEARSSVEQWLDPLARTAEELFTRVGDVLDRIDPHTVGEAELDRLLAEVEPEAGLLSPVFEDFLGGLVRKAKTLAKGAVSLAKKGVAVASRLLPTGILFRHLAGLVRPLLQRVVTTAINRLPASVQPLARRLAAHWGIAASPATSEAVDRGLDMPSRLASEFDVQASAVLLAPAEADQQALLAEVAAEAESLDDRAALTELDVARARLARELVASPAGERPVAPIEQFIPAVMAVMPVIRAGLGLVGRDRVVGFLADRLASLVRPQVGAAAAGQIARPIVDVGLRMLGLEVPAEAGPELAGEALAATIEETVRAVLDLPTEAFDDELLLEATAQQAFAEAAATYLPDEVIAPDLPERETHGPGGVWVAMPRRARPHFRFRRYTEVFPVTISPQLAAAVPWRDGGTLESFLLDAGVRRLPVEAEVHLYELLPGASAGHLHADEQEPAHELGEAQPLTPQVAGLLLHEPRLAGRRASPFARGPAALPGGGPARMYRLRIPGTVIDPAGRARAAGLAGRAVRMSRPRRRVGVAVTVAPGQTALRLHLRLSEREGQDLGERLARSDQRGAVTALGSALSTRARSPLGAAVLRLRRPTPGAAPAASGAPEEAGRAADQLLAKAAAALSPLVKDRATAIADAIRHSAQGLTLSFTFTARDAAALLADIPSPTVQIRPGWARE